MTGQVLLPDEVLDNSVFTLADYSQQVVTYVLFALALPTERDAYLKHIGIDKESKGRVKLDDKINGILLVYKSMHRNCATYNTETHPKIVRLATNIMRYASKAGDVYARIYDLLQGTEVDDPSTRVFELDMLIGENVTTIDGYERESKEAKERMENFRQLTSLDHGAAERQSMHLDGYLSALDRQKKLAPAQPATSSEGERFQWKPPFLKKYKKLEVTNRLDEIRKIGDALLSWPFFSQKSLEKICDWADTAVKALDELIGGFRKISEDLRKIQRLVRDDLRVGNWDEILGDCPKDEIIGRWGILGQRAKSYIINDAYSPAHLNPH